MPQRMSCIKIPPLSTVKSYRKRNKSAVRTKAVRINVKLRSPQDAVRLNATLTPWRGMLTPSLHAIQYNRVKGCDCMKTLLLLGCLFFSVMAGYWLMVKLDGFLARGGIRPYWDEEEEALYTKRRNPGRGKRIGIRKLTMSPGGICTPAGNREASPFSIHFPGKQGF